MGRCQTIIVNRLCRGLAVLAVRCRHIAHFAHFADFPCSIFRSHSRLPSVALVIILLIVGVALLLMETMLPGLVAGILGFCCLVAGLVLGYARLEERMANLLLVLVLLILVGGFATWVKFFPNSRLGRVFVSQRVVGNIDAEKPELLHKTGVAHTPLRPSGTAVINGQRIDVITEGPFIERGAGIKVVAIEGMRVVVRALSEQSSNIPQVTKQFS